VKYIVVGGSALVTFALWLGEQWLSQRLGAVYGAIPWGWLCLLVLAFLCGAIYCDLVNRNSRLRSKLREMCRVVDVDGFVLAHNSNVTPWQYEAKLMLSFRRRTDAAKCVVEVTQYVGHPQGARTFVVKAEQVAPVEPNLRKDLIVACFPERMSNDVPQKSPYWGCDQSKTWAGDGRHLITLRIHGSLFRRQVEHFLIEAIRNVSSSGPEPVLVFGGPRDRGLLLISAPA
jgi:hypothetical protein